MAVDLAIVIAAVVLTLLIVILVIGMLICHFCVKKKERNDKNEPDGTINTSEGHKSVGPREIRSDGSFPYTPIREMDKPKSPRKIVDVEPDEADAKNKDNTIKTTNVVTNKTPSNALIKKTPSGTAKNTQGVRAISINRSKGKIVKKSKDMIPGSKNNPKVIIAKGPNDPSSPPLSPPPKSPTQSLLSSPQSPKTSPDSSSSSKKSPGAGSNMTSDSAPEPAPISDKLEKQVKLVDDKTHNSK